MILVVDSHSGIPVYRQLMEQIKFHVASGVLRPGDEIPSTRTLSAELGVNPMTISRAFSQLEVEGVLERRPGLPLVVRTQRPAARRATQKVQLQKVLAPVVTRVRQLGIEDADAVELFRQLLEKAKNPGR